MTSHSYTNIQHLLLPDYGCGRVDVSTRRCSCHCAFVEEAAERIASWKGYWKAVLVYFGSEGYWKALAEVGSGPAAKVGIGAVDRDVCEAAVSVTRAYSCLIHCQSLIE